MAAEIKTPGKVHPRPLSPHLQIYRPQYTSILSITHRVTGVALSVGTLLLVWWLAAAALGDSVSAPRQYWRSQPASQKNLFGPTSFGTR
jgi:succinate dehydrogenase / fumarate reductase cytochrome b subunit